MARRRTLQILLSVLALFLFGTVVVLSTVTFYLAIDAAAYLTEEEVGPMENGTRWNGTEHGQAERVPRIIHQTWKTEILPDRWKGISRECREMMADYDYMLWTDASSREFIANKYPWFLDTFDAYTYPIQRADAIRYFVLYYYGGVYLDLDVGCRRPLDRLLVYPIVLPKTIPVGVSNDLMFAEKNHPFMDQTIHNLVTFDHSWVLNYPTVMFSTGPMFLSAQFGIWTSSHLPTPDSPAGEVRILPKSLYGKNAKSGEAPHAFFSHFYGSSWHADDAAFIGFLGKWGKGLMWVGLVLLVIGIARLAWQKQTKSRDGAGRGGYEVLLPRSYQRNGRWHIDLGRLTLTTRGSGQSSLSSPVSASRPSSPSSDEENLPILPISFDPQPSSPTASESSSSESVANRTSRRSSTVDAILRAGSRAMAYIPGVRPHDRRSRSSRRSWQNRGVLFFLPAIFTPHGAPLVELSSRRGISTRSPSAAPDSNHPLDKSQYSDDLPSEDVYGASSSTRAIPVPLQTSTSRPRSPASNLAVHPNSAPPPYHMGNNLGSGWSTENGWEEWESR